MAPHLSSAARLVYLGSDLTAERAPVFAADLPDGCEWDPEAGEGQRREWSDARSAGPQMTAGDAAMVARANGLLAWHRK